MTRDFQQCGILTNVGSDEPVQPSFKLINLKIGSVSSHRIFKRLAMALISLPVGAGWSEPLLVANTSCHGLFSKFDKARFSIVMTTIIELILILSPKYALQYNIFGDRSKAVRLSWIICVFVSCVSHAFASVHCCLVVTY